MPRKARPQGSTRATGGIAQPDVQFAQTRDDGLVWGKTRHRARSGDGTAHGGQRPEIPPAYALHRQFWRRRPQNAGDQSIERQLFGES